MKLFFFLPLMSLAFQFSAQNTDSLISSLYFNDGLSVLDSSGFNFNLSYYPSTSDWGIDSFPESVVFDAELSYENILDSTQSYQVRIGKGGQLYSFRGSFGESVPPQWRPTGWALPTYGGGTSYAPWVDEVWQMVCVDGSLNNPPDSAYFIHQSGVYLKTPGQTQPFYSPMVARYFNPAKMSYSVVNWGQQAHTEDLENMHHTSSLLYYTTYTNKGNGIIQVDKMIYNFGNDNIDFLNMPWGGVRNSNLEHFFISTPTNAYTNTPGIYGTTPVIPTASTGGWVAWSNDTLGNSPALGMAHPLTTNTNNSVFRYGDAGDLTAAWNNRDYHVFEMIRFPSAGQLGFGKSMSFRYFFVLGTNVDSVKNTILNHSLVSNALDTAYTPSFNEVDSIRYLFESVGSAIHVSVSTDSTGLLLKSHPFLNSYPLFKLTSANNEEVLTSDPYYFSGDAYDGTTVDINLLGFLDDPTNITVQMDTICNGENYVFPDGSLEISPTADLIQNSILSANQPGWDSIVITQLTVLSYDLSVLQAGTELTSNELGSNYQWLNCDSSFSLIIGANGIDFTALNSGNYAVEISDEHCIDTSSCYFVSIITSLNNELANKIILFPNPTNGQLSIALDKVYPVIILRITSLKGELIQKNKYKNTALLEINLEEPPGVYNVTIEADSQKANIRLVKD